MGGQGMAAPGAQLYQTSDSLARRSTPPLRCRCVRPLRVACSPRPGALRGCNGGGTPCA